MQGGLDLPPLLRTFRPLSLDDLEAALRPAFLAGLEGDAAAYRRFLDLIGVRLRGFLRGHLARAGIAGNDEAEDVLQETLLALHLSRHTYDPAIPVSAWAHAIARYKLIDHLRRSGRHRGHLPIEDEALALSVSAGAASEAKLDVERALSGLPERTRRLIDRVKLQGASLAEAAQAAGMTETAAKVALHRGLKAMAKILVKRGTRPP
ncbi:MAG: RNA polymerase subunit sigma [Hyphomicrobiales bacterium]|nr:MAG: RNA polymerase subunit sigma [Hyphomicrobiales bacterium]